MTPKEVLQNIEKQREEAGIAFLGNIYLEVPEYWEVINALEKQMPKKPYFRKEEDATGYACPVCDMGVTADKGRIRDTYCSHCGQFLDWSEKE